MKTAGIVILILGLGMLLFTTINYFGSEKIVEIADVQIRASHAWNLSWLPFSGLAVMVIGAYLYLKSSNRSV